jgi:ribosomal protein S18 acetylase RimI-like enzyme
MNPPMVRSATEDERPTLHHVVTLAFATDPLARWTVPGSTDYFISMPMVVDAVGCGGLPHGTAYVVDDLAGVALWLPPGVEPDGERTAALTEAYVHPDVKEEFAAVLEEMGRYHPEEPHWYLPMIAVDPAVQGRGYGAALMRHAVQRFDRDGAIAYLESTNPRNISLYERHGFEILATIQIGRSPPVTPMLRMPK